MTSAAAALLRWLSARTGFSLALNRLKEPATALGLAFGVVFVLLAASLERRSAPTGAIDRTLSGAVFGLTLPLVAYAIVASATGRVRLDDAVSGLTRWGARRNATALGMVSACMAIAAVLGALLAGLGVVVARVPSDGAFATDLATSSWLGLLAGGAYAALFCFGATFGARGGGRLVLLAIDWILGASAGTAAVPVLRGHVRNLLGAEPVLGMPQWAALLCLLGIGTVCASAAIWRSRR